MADTTLDARSWAQECSRRTSALGVDFYFDPDAATAYTDGQRVICPAPPANATAEDFTLLRGQVVHECGHIVRKEIFDKVRDIKGGSPQWAILNIVEDASQERDVARRYPGDEKTVSDMWGILMRRQINEARKAEPIADADAASKTQRMVAAGVMGRLAAADWQKRATAQLPEFLDAVEHVAPGITALSETLEAEGWAQRIRGARTVDEAIETARALHKRLFPKEHAEQEQQAKSRKGKKGEKGETIYAGEGNHDRPEKGLTDEEVEAAAEIPWQVILGSDHGQEKLNGVPAPSRIDWTGKPRGGAVAWYPSEHVTTPPSNGAVSTTVLTPDPTLISDVRRRLQVLARRKWHAEKLSGKFDARNATRLVMPRVGDGTYNYSVFKEQDPRWQLDTAVTVLVDCSGSMSGPKHKAAAQAAVALYDLFARALRVPCEILGFTTATGPVYYTFKTFAERRMDRRTLAGRILSSRVSGLMAGNSDGDAILWAFDRIKTRREKRKVIIVLSDGSPSSAASGDPAATLEAAIRAVRSAPGGEVYGIGIMDTNVRRFYSPTAPVITRPDEVTGALIHTLQDVLQRRPGGGL